MLSAVGLPRFLHSQFYGNGLTILQYHAVIREPLQFPDWCFLHAHAFRTQIAYVKRHFRVVTLLEAVELLTSGPIAQPLLVVTFDDGYKNNHDVAFPILQEYECPATIFISTRYINADETPWFCRLNMALELTRKISLSWHGLNFDLSTPTRKSRASSALHKLLKKHHPYDIDDLVTDICQKLAGNDCRSTYPGSPYSMLSTESIRAMLNSGLVAFGAHTHNHTILGRLSPEEQKEEILNSLRMVQEFTGQPCRSFSYPNGSYDHDTVELLKAAGVTRAVSTVQGANTSATPVLELRRYGVGSDLSISEFESLVHGVYHRIRSFRPQAAF
ncbi:MAG: polysaccharide deacetylase family protein [Candidatus Sulfotelmatobacter sp.]|jgi:peptidoglycan/xylan/chitin deacetylase (PgdA/CDA1 family)